MRPEVKIAFATVALTPLLAYCGASAKNLGETWLAGRLYATPDGTHHISVAQGYDWGEGERMQVSLNGAGCHESVLQFRGDLPDAVLARWDGPRAEIETLYQGSLLSAFASCRDRYRVSLAGGGCNFQLVTLTEGCRR
jgi:hypothetical protein